MGAVGRDRAGGRRIPNSADRIGPMSRNRLKVEFLAEGLGISQRIINNVLTLNLLYDVDRSDEDFDAVVARPSVGGFFDEEEVVGARVIGFALDACARRGS